MIVTLAIIGTYTTFWLQTLEIQANPTTIPYACTSHAIAPLKVAQ
jgi:hypothetical protein